MVCSALVAGCRGSGAGQQAKCPGRGMLHDGVVQHPSAHPNATPQYVCIDLQNLTRVSVEIIS